MSNANETFDVKTASTAELVAKYNELTGKSIKKFSSRAAGEKQVSAFLSATPKAAAPKKPAVKSDGVEKAKPDAKKVESKKAMSDLAKQVASISRSSAKKKAEAAATVSRSDAVAASWDDPAVKAARSVKNKVKVNGVEYRSVKAAFEALKLPLEKHIVFRGELKATGRKNFEGHTFTIVAG